MKTIYQKNDLGVEKLSQIDVEIDPELGIAWLCKSSKPFGQSVV